MSDVPPHVTELAERRARARADRDYAGADALRDDIEAEGWTVRDVGDGFELAPRPSFKVWPTVSSVPVTGAGGRQPERSAEAGIRPEGHGIPAATNRDTDAGTGRDTAAGTAGAGDGTRTGEPAGSGGAAAGTGHGASADVGRGDAPDAERVAAAAEPGARPEEVGQLDAERVGEAEAAPRPRPEGAELLGRSDDVERAPERMVSSQLLWDSSLAVSRVDEEITPVEGRKPMTSPTVTVGLVVDGWPDDLRECVRALLAHTDAKIVALDLGDVDGAGAVLQELADADPERIQAWHVAETPHWRGGTAGWGESRNKLLELDDSDVHVVMETSVVLDGDAITPLAGALNDKVSAAGWKGVDPGEDRREWKDAGPGDVRAVLGHLFAVRRDAALSVGGFPSGARYYRNADLEFSLTIPGTVVALGDELPVHEGRHRGYHDVDPEYRERESRRTYERVLRLLGSP
ncbi:glycosyltransferase family 2 protein [Streptosporangium sp. NPDC004379]|uniref:glycosyltransferase family 2 protein n=1 Tax=Streptosporangium sp. NPDC004379 TaxID=3366189 RepID=UPI00369A1ED4